MKKNKFRILYFKLFCCQAELVEAGFCLSIGLLKLHRLRQAQADSICIQRFDIYRS
jgi:hypothetical protein